MEIKITDEHDNTLLSRKEIKFTIEHPGSAIPSREVVVSRLCALLNKEKDTMILREIQGQFGGARSEALVYIYENEEAMKAVEPPYMLKRNKLVEEEK
ncbi:MAG: 30S ribosomal protein S24e [Candidatus Heimdallarchaeota archaeon]|nr:30S ribosomal protein S24e [Candidatus Heimdallarchaeota archaeon]MCK5048242.1 30S ribosomal protein S24e [Candidatus Heimdallarchaeota archaeon]